MQFHFFNILVKTSNSFCWNQQAELTLTPNGAGTKHEVRLDLDSSRIDHFTRVSCRALLVEEKVSAEGTEKEELGCYQDSQVPTII